MGLFAAAQQNIGLDADGAQVPSPNAASAWFSVRPPLRCKAPASDARKRRARGPARCPIGGWPRRTAGPRCRPPCRRFRTSRKSMSSVPAMTNSLIMSVTCGITCTVRPRYSPRALALDHLAVDAPRGDVVGFPRGDAGEALVMAEVEIGLRAIVGDVNLAMLERAHRARIDIQIRVQLAQTHAIAARLQKRTERCGRKTFSQGRDHAAGDEDQPRHGRPPCPNARACSSAIVTLFLRL